MTQDWINNCPETTRSLTGQRCPCFIQTLCCVKVLKTVYSVLCPDDCQCDSTNKSTSINMSLFNCFSQRDLHSNENFLLHLCLLYSALRFVSTDFSVSRCTLRLVHTLHSWCLRLYESTCKYGNAKLFVTPKSHLDKSVWICRVLNETLHWVVVIVYSLPWWYFYC